MRFCQPQSISVPSQSLVFSCAMIFAPAFPSASFDPVCCGCQHVLKSISTGFPPDFSATSFSNSGDRSAEPPFTSKTPSVPITARTLPPAPPIRRTEPVSLVASRGALAGTGPVCARAPRARAIPAAPPARFCRNRRRLEARGFEAGNTATSLLCAASSGSGAPGHCKG